MSRYKYEHDEDDWDDEREDKYDDDRDDDDRGKATLDLDLDVDVAPVVSTVNNVVNVVVNPPKVEVDNQVTIVTNQITSVIQPPAPPLPTTNYIYGSSKKDYLVGTDADDVIYGYQGNDMLIDGTGADKLYGSKGKNTYKCTADGQVDFVYVKKDKQPDIIQFVGPEDRIDIRGSKFTFHHTSRGVEIFSNSKLQAIYTGDNLSLSQLQSITI
jgi:Ca2+-binding RTX toxin-like protein